MNKSFGCRLKNGSNKEVNVNKFSFLLLDEQKPVTSLILQKCIKRILLKLVVFPCCETF